MLLLITGCINVNNGVPFTTIVDDKERLKDYCKTIEWALNQDVYNKIVFCENSNYKFDYEKYLDIAKKNGKHFEYLTFVGNVENVKKYGKGYGEGEILEYFFKNSVLLNDENFFCKITGRLIVTNVQKLIKNTNKNYFCNKIISNEVDTRFYYVNKKMFSKYLLKSYLNVNDNNGYYLEHSYFDSLNNSKIKYRCFYQKPLFDGKSGSTGRNYMLDNGKNNIFINLLYALGLYNSKIIKKIYLIKMVIK